eukprot:1154210-Pelagomonas_calceolata.AAC.11
MSLCKEWPSGRAVAVKIHLWPATLDQRIKLCKLGILLSQPFWGVNSNAASSHPGHWGGLCSCQQLTCNTGSREHGQCHDAPCCAGRGEGHES